MNRFANLLSPSSPKAGGAEKDSASAMGGTASKLQCHGSQPRAPQGTSLGKRHEGSSPSGLQSVRSWQENMTLAPGGPPSSYYSAMRAGGPDSYRGNQGKGSRSMGGDKEGDACRSLGASSTQSYGRPTGRDSARKKKLSSSSGAKQTLAQLMGSAGLTKEREPK